MGGRNASEDGFQRAFPVCDLFLLRVLPVAANAGITDPVGDFLSTYTGTKDPGLDVVSANVTLEGAQFGKLATMDGAIAPLAGTLPGAVFVWGLDRGAGTERFVSELRR
jgi:hypothetical protein